jgi:hypothetical protein
MFADFFKKNIDNINSFLVVFSFALAIIIPFELFLFAYAILGPIHYLSQIAWLEKKNFFLNNLNRRNFFVAMSTFVAILFFIKFYSDNFLKIELSEKYINNFISTFIFIIFCSAGVLVFQKSYVKIFFLFWGIIFIALILQYVFFYEIIFNILLVTVIHVWFFTAIFMLNGTIASKSKHGLITFVIFLLCSSAFFFIENTHYEISNFVFNILNLKNFTTLNSVISDLFSLKQRNYLGGNNSVQSFIAFAYTYHYLNWFFKAEIIKWHKISRLKIAIVLGFYFVILICYAIDYRLGFFITFFLSIIHVFLEFPLNFLSFRDLKKHLF